MAVRPLLVQKRNSKAKFRMTLDTRPINVATIVEAWQMPHMEAETKDFPGSQCFASTDFVSGYWQLPLGRALWEKCGVVTPTGAAASTRVVLPCIHDESNCVESTSISYHVRENPRILLGLYYGRPNRIFGLGTTVSISEKSEIC